MTSEEGPPPGTAPRPADVVTSADVERARLRADKAEQEAREAEARARQENARVLAGVSGVRADVGVRKASQEISQLRFMRSLRAIAMAGGLALTAGGVIDEMNNWLPDGDGTALVTLGVGGLVGSALGGDKKKKEKADAED